MWLKITQNYSPNFNTPKRQKKNIKYIIVHYTGMKNELSALNRLTDYKSKVSAHYFIKKDGKIINLVPDLYEAWHAGKSNWKNIQSLNRYSIGVEIQNSGHENLYEKFPNKQMSSVKKLLRFLTKRYRINCKNILGHSDIAPNRKKDPGEKFPWKELAKFKLAHWHKLDEKKLKQFRLKKINLLDENKFFRNLRKIGYTSVQSKSSIDKKKLLVKAFQRRFRQGLVNGITDQECLILSKNLL
ncbi:N-acetylmuramoyl-L-alanine amidase [Candidatus Pelagibacter sp. RS39]|uniref:N-acetylmuramoyl-L-alanine amidase n=1 Tax=Candidatus Pelagibacter sp. RS39 TaxID=1977864 RepID=UPI000A15277A|nr:N-acetylmuramoyl-L-alanine amidase [Candidatus Pelagibacter sp. RS39]ARJ48235.1 N-acetylmuramoyl-L-alanine amidase [Candidatus Pelagibacter sp. RS39]